MPATKVPITKVFSNKVFSIKVSSKKFLISSTLILASAWTIAGAQNAPAVGGNVKANVKANGTTVRGKHAFMTVVTEPPRSIVKTNASTVTTTNDTKTNIPDSAPVTIFSNLASEYPNGEYWCCTGYNIMGPSSGIGEQWMAAAFTPYANRNVTKITVAVGFSQGTTNGVVLGLRADNNGVPGKWLKGWTISGLPRFGTCCALVSGSDTSGIPVTGGQQYWVILKTDATQLDTVDGWNVTDTDQVYPRKIAVFPGAHNAWYVFHATPGLAFSVEGN
jgi:hypothetical protein